LMSLHLHSTYVTVNAKNEIASCFMLAVQGFHPILLIRVEASYLSLKGTACIA
jgi:hypothetical protein